MQWSQDVPMSSGYWRVTFERLKVGIAKRVGFNVDDINGAASIEVLDAGETVIGPACIALPGQYERVRACAFGVDVTEELTQVQGGPRRIGPTQQIVLRDVTISQGTLYSRGRCKFFNYKLDQSAASWAEHDEVALRSSFLGCHFFGHWLRDDCATHMLAEQVGVPIGMPTPPWPDRAGYLKLFNQSHMELGRAHVRRLVLFDDISQNAHKAERLRALRTRVATGRTPQNTGHIVYLMRGAGGTRRSLLNEDEIASALERRGVIIVRSETLPVPELTSVLLGAKLVISIEGSQLSHALYTLDSHGGILIIQPPDRFFNSHMDWARALHMQYGIVVGEQRETGFHLPVDDLMRTIDLMLDAKKNCCNG
jgi:hypothetical protein